ncbi:UvrD-helicase domain-containing protein [Candidatus Deianiraea vastatrix]|uniref:DNA 3'-5' helicase n=1 Tax=Candidatus Deianiraea vastatrix TaxID=2163644 RepID=A0A5B8XCL0_9RICK|nr:UvrD-helicase domain-containing protein [Candidatus Deianiraea vastatrix]QED23099.1 ATP-dependent helicase/nuclease subunit A [Candidatus Deianiraea vastatrix]
MTDILSKIQDECTNIFISANAGSGKTKVLVDRVISLILSGVCVDKILCITYTENSTHEMQERIFSKISSLFLQIKQGDLKEIKTYKNYQDQDTALRLFRNALLDIERLNVCTFHAFCAKILRQTSAVTNILPDFTILTENDVKMYKKYVKDVIFDEISEENDKKIDKIIAKYGKHWFEEFVNNGIDNLHLFAKIIRKKEEYRGIYGSFVGLPAKDMEDILNDFFSDSILQKNIENSANSGSKQSEIVKKWCNLEKKYINEDLISAYFTNGKIRSRGMSDADILAAESLQKFCKNAFISHSFFTTFLLLDFFEIVYFKYQNLKNEHNCLDFDDIIYILYENIKNPAVMEVIFAKYDHILLDESQDMSKQQWEIIDEIFGEFLANKVDKIKTIFAVGDEKQSIYGFRGASVANFQQRMVSYAQKSADFGAKFEKIELLTSYRSRPEILSFVDKFCKLTGDFSNLSNAKHLASTQEEGVVLINEIEESEEKFNYIWAICDKILEINRGGMAFSDIMVLVKKRKKDGIYGNFLRIAKEKKIPVNSDKEQGNITKICLLDFTALLGLVNDILDEYLLAGLLKSPLFGFCDDEIFELKKSGRLNIHSLKSDERFFKIYDILMKISAKTNNISQFFAQIAEYEEIFDKFVKFYGKSLIYQILDILTTQGDDGVLVYRYILENIDDIEIKNPSFDGVKIMTVHGSKGLQARAVFYIDDNFAIDKLAKSGNSQGFYSIFLRPDCRFFTAKSRSLKFAESMCKALGEDLFSLEIEEKNKIFELSEQNRVFYVAFTRAAEFLALYVNNASLIIDYIG